MKTAVWYKFTCVHTQTQTFSEIKKKKFEEKEKKNYVKPNTHYESAVYSFFLYLVVVWCSLVKCVKCQRKKQFIAKIIVNKYKKEPENHNIKTKIEIVMEICVFA